MGCKVALPQPVLFEETALHICRESDAGGCEIIFSSFVAQRIERMRRVSTGPSFLLLTIVALAGCGGADYGDRQPIRGTVTFKGSPLDQGTIQFTPKSGSSFGAAEIKNGEYVIPVEGGLSPGTYEVRVSSGDSTAPASEPLPGESGPPAKERIPEEFNSKTTLEFTVSTDGDNTYNVEIP